MTSSLQSINSLVRNNRTVTRKGGTSISHSGSSRRQARRITQAPVHESTELKSTRADRDIYARIPWPSSIAHSKSAGGTLMTCRSTPLLGTLHIAHDCQRSLWCGPKGSDARCCLLLETPEVRWLPGASISTYTSSRCPLIMRPPTQYYLSILPLVEMFGVQRPRFVYKCVDVRAGSNRRQSSLLSRAHNLHVHPASLRSMRVKVPFLNR